MRRGRPGHHRSLWASPTSNSRKKRRRAWNARRWRRRRHPDHARLKLKGALSRTTSVVRGAAFARILAAPRLFGNGPSRHPVCEACVAIVWRRRGSDRRAAAPPIDAALPVHPATPLFLLRRPACLPVRETICAVVRVCGARRRCWRRDRGGTSEVVDLAAPRLLKWRPGVLRVDGAIVRIHRS